MIGDFFSPQRQQVLLIETLWIKLQHDYTGGFVSSGDAIIPKHSSRDFPRSHYCDSQNYTLSWTLEHVQTHGMSALTRLILLRWNTLPCCHGDSSNQGSIDAGFWRAAVNELNSRCSYAQLIKLTPISCSGSENSESPTCKISVGLRVCLHCFVKQSDPSNKPTVKVHPPGEKS